MSLKLGYLVPEFPGQTHMFFSREIDRLRSMGVAVQLISTRPPPRAVISHDWAQQAQLETIYLFRGLSFSPLFDLLKAFLRQGPKAWFRCFRSFFSAEGLTLRGRFKLLGFMLFGSKLALLAQENDLEHIHVHSCSDAAHVAMYAKLMADVPYSITLHGPLGDYGPNQKQKWKNAAFAIVITKKLVKEIQKSLSGFLPPSIYTAPMGVNENIFQRSTPYQPWNGQGPCEIFSVGRLNICKGHDDLIKAVKDLRGRGFDARLKIAGQDEQGGTGYRVDLQKLIESLEMEPFVELLGAVSEHRVKRGICESHIFALASLDEPLGVAIMEAMALEVPVIIARSGGVMELVDHDVDGILVPPRDPKALADAMEQILKDPSLAQRLSHMSRRKIVENFHDRRSADVLEIGIKSLPLEG